MRRRRLWLLGGTAGFNFLFWLLLSHQYEIKGFLLGYPYTVLVGSVALGSLVCLSASVRQTLPPLPARSLNWHSLRQTRPLLLLLALGVLFLAALLGCALGMAWQVLVWGYLLAVLLPYLLWPVRSLLVLLTLGVWTLAVSLGGRVLGLTPVFVGGLLLPVLPAYVSSVFLFYGVVRLLRAAASPKLVALLATTLAAVTLVPVISVYAFLVLSAVPSCAQRFVSPSGQYTLVLQKYDDQYEGGSFVVVYVESGWWGREIPSSLHAYDTCTEHSLKLRWSADEKQIDWQTPSEHGYWRR